MSVVSPVASRMRSHDALGDLTELTWPDGTSERWERDALGRPLSATDRAGAVTRYSWDAVGDLDYGDRKSVV